MLLSILICHLRSREEKLKRLFECLRAQGACCNWHPYPEWKIVGFVGTNPHVEVRIARDNGEMSIGAKRNLLLDSCVNSEYVCYHDDDDMPSQDYLSKILKALESKPDCVGFEGQLVRTGGPTSRFIHSIKYDHWYEENSVYLRSPNHLNPVRRELALKVRFPDLYSAEDADYSKRLYPLLKTETFIDGGPIYQYLK